MEKKNKKEEIQSRREFFKSAAKKALPVLGAVVLAAIPFTEAKAQWGCSGNCMYGCEGCNDSCYGSCKGTCGSSCNRACSYGCRTGCMIACTGVSW
jgi:CXXX repeat radical SAM target protein